MRLKTTFYWALFFVLCAVSCKKWDEHNQVTNQDVSKTLTDEISQHPNLSKFYEYLQKTGLDKELASSKAHTVWAPVNEALKNLDAAIVNDTAKLRRFMSNHIAYQSYFTKDAAASPRVAMLNGKWVSFTNTKFDDATITEADKFVSNGVLQVIDKVAPVYANAWELLDSTKTTYQQSAFILSLTRKVFDPTNAVVDSINSQTGLPVYKPGTDSVIKNSFNTDVYDLQREDKQYTYFIMSDTGLNSEVSKLNTYFKTSTADSTKNLASFAVVKDLIVEGVYAINQLPSVLVSKSGVKIPIDVSKIVATRKMSNGIAYVIGRVAFNVKEKIPTVIVEGENYLRFFDANGLAVTPRQNNVSAVFIRTRLNPSNVQFVDMFTYNHGISALSAQYTARRLPSVNYKVYWVVPNDTLRLNGVVNPVVFNQRLAMGVRGANFLPTTPATGMAMPINTYTEAYIGDYVQAMYGNLDMFLTANASTGAGTNTLNLDYIKLVPDIQ
ncbi:fasciclin domain-containing protein [Pinibacter sp. MAH-24]|uniref:Fasciclin domain-containing protein n=1 Tax=Pinibacter soli TaxID=3044211 RepID=A0ABT6R9P1_9BACT|nr:fasciclin domain-containing protein [Pinibacter soli]